MTPPQVLSAGIIVADHVCTPIPHVPAAGELVMADGMLLTIGGCAANAAVDLVKMGVPKAVQEELVPVFAEAQRLGVKTVLDVATPGPAKYLPRLEKLLPHVDVFLPNNHEGQLICGEKDPVRQAETFRRLGVKTAVITM